MLAVPDFSTLRSYFGKLGTPSFDAECQHIVNSVFEKLEGSQKFCKILLDEIHIKALRFKSHYWIFD